MTTTTLTRFRFDVRARRGSGSNARRWLLCLAGPALLLGCGGGPLELADDGDPTALTVILPDPFAATDLGPLESVASMNSAEDVAIIGHRRLPDFSRRGFVFRPSTGLQTLRPLDIHDFNDPLAAGINDAGTIVGSARDDASFLSVTALPVQLPHLQPNDGDGAVAINASGVIVGTTHTQPGDFIIDVPTRWQRNAAGVLQVEALDTGGIDPVTHQLFPGQARDVNDAGTVVGVVGQHPVIFRDGQAPQQLSSESGQANGVGRNGHVTGGLNQEGGGQRAFIFTASGGLVRLALPLRNLFGTNVVSSRGNKVNVSGLAAGLALQANGFQRAYLWSRNEGFLDLNGATEDLPEGASLTEAIDINDRNDILCLGLVNGAVHGFLLRPTGARLIFRRF
jgi:hypothetical protein